MQHLTDSWQLRYGISLQVWPSGSVKDSVDALDFTDLQGIDCMVEKFPLAKANDAFGTRPAFPFLSNSNFSQMPCDKEQ